MSRKKPAKRPATRQTTAKAVKAAKPAKITAKSSMNVHQMEKDFQDTPAKLIASIKKEIAAQTQKQTKAKSALVKLAKQIKSSEKRIKAAGKNKTAAGKKQLTAAKKLHAEMMKSEIAHTKEIKEAATSVAALQMKAKKMAALSKYISQFEKDWAKQEKEAAAKANQKEKEKMKAKKAAKAAAKAAAKKQKAEALAAKKQQAMEKQQNTADDMMSDEITETIDTTEAL